MKTYVLLMSTIVIAWNATHARADSRVDHADRTVAATDNDDDSPSRRPEPESPRLNQVAAHITPNGDELVAALAEQNLSQTRFKKRQRQQKVKPQRPRFA